MNIIDEIITALGLMSPSDLEAAKRYLRWMQLRRQVNNHFYFAAHWMVLEKQYHWVGRSE